MQQMPTGCGLYLRRLAFAPHQLPNRGRESQFTSIHKVLSSSKLVFELQSLQLSALNCPMRGSSVGGARETQTISSR